MRIYIALGIRNMLRRKKLLIHMIFGYFILVTIILSNIVYSNIINNNISYVENNSISNNYFTLSGLDSDIDVAKTCTLLFSINDIESIIVESDYSVLNLLEDSHIQHNQGLVNIEETEIILEGNIHKGISLADTQLSDYKLSKSDIEYYFDIDYIDYNYSIFAKNEITEFKNKFNKNNVFIYGGVITDENDIILSELLLLRYGIKATPDLIGQTISILLFNDSSEKFQTITNYVICGIIDSDFFKIDSRIGAPHIIISNKNIDSNITISLFANNIKNINYIKEQIEILTDIMPDYHFIKYDIYKGLNIQREIINTILSLVGFILFISSFAYIFNLYFYYISERKSYLALQKACGMTQKMLISICLTELLFIELISFLIASIITTLSVSLYTDYLMKMFNIAYRITIIDFLSYLTTTFLLITTLSFALSLITAFILKRKTIRESFL